MSEELRLILALAVVVVLGGVVGWWTLRTFRQVTDGRRILQELAQSLGLEWTPAKNTADTLGAGRAKGRHRGYTVTVETEDQRGGRTRYGLPAALVRVRFADSLGLSLHGGSGSYRARKGEPAELEGPLAKFFRVVAQEPDHIRTLLADERVVAAIDALEALGRGTKLDDGTLEVRLDFPTSVEAFTVAVDRAVHAAEAIDAAG